MSSILPSRRVLHSVRNPSIIYSSRNKNTNYIKNIERNQTLYNINKNQSNINNTINIYKPKKPTLSKVGSRLRIGLPPNPLLNKMNLQMQSNFFNNNKSTKNIFTKGKNLGKYLM